MVAACYFYKAESSYIKGFLITSGHVSGFKYEHGAGTGTGADNRIKTTVVSYRVGSKDFKIDARGLQIPSFTEQIEVYYDPNEPAIARVNRIDEVYLFTLIMSFLFLMGSLSAILTALVKKAITAS